MACFGDRRHLLREIDAAAAVPVETGKPKLAASVQRRDQAVAVIWEVPIGMLAAESEMRFAGASWLPSDRRSEERATNKSNRWRQYRGKQTWDQVESRYDCLWQTGDLRWPCSTSAVAKAPLCASRKTWRPKLRSLHLDRSRTDDPAVALPLCGIEQTSKSRAAGESMIVRDNS